MPRPDDKGPKESDAESSQGDVCFPAAPQLHKLGSGLCKSCGAHNHKELRQSVDRMERELCKRLDHIDSCLSSMAGVLLESAVVPKWTAEEPFGGAPSLPVSTNEERSRTLQLPCLPQPSDNSSPMTPAPQPEVFSLRAEFQLNDPMAVQTLKSSDWKTLDDFNLPSPTSRGFPFPVLSPSGHFRLLWDVMSMVLIAFDMALIPVNLAFATGDNAFSKLVFWPQLSFWTLDVLLTFVTGIYMDGRVELSYPIIALQYCKTWFMLDAFMVGVMWYEVAGAESQRGLLLGRATKTLRAVRVLRSVRLLRLMKLRRIVEDFQDRVNSEHFHTAVGVIRLTTFIIWTNHFIACGWWALGTREVSDDGEAWATHYRYVDAPVGTQYFTSLHWSLTQFTPASMEVQPRNLYERIYAVIVLLFAMIVFSSFVSSITAAMTQLRKMSSTLDKNYSMLRRYLHGRNTPTDLTVRIVRCVDYRLATRRQGVMDESEVEFLKLLSKPLQMELLCQNYSPTITKHPFFRRFAAVDPVAMQHICRDAVSKSSLSTGDALFTDASSGKHMYFLLTGQLRYFPNSRAGRRRKKSLGSAVSRKWQNTPWRRSHSYRPVSECLIEEGEWCCEGCLWTKWSHSGSMRAVRMSEVLALDATVFALIINSHRLVVSSTIRYGMNVVDRLNVWAVDGVVSDLMHLSVKDTEELVDSAFHELKQSTRRTLSPQTPQTPQSPETPPRTENFPDDDFSDVGACGQCVPCAKHSAQTPQTPPRTSMWRAKAVNSDTCGV